MSSVALLLLRISFGELGLLGTRLCARTSGLFGTRGCSSKLLRQGLHRSRWALLRMLCMRLLLGFCMRRKSGFRWVG